MDLWLLDWQVVSRIAAALLGGGVLGWERELRRKPAGLRTHMMVSLGAALMMLVALRFMDAMVDPAKPHGGQFDLAKVMEGIVGGIGFLGAGAIIQSRDSVRGLTTAASVWLSATVGVACGMGYFDLAAGAVLMGIVVLVLLGMVEGVLTGRTPEAPDPRRPGRDAGTP